MDIIYYYDNRLGLSPVKEYFKNYLVSSKDLDYIARRKLKILADIDAKINFISKNQARPTPPISKPLHNYNFFEIINSKDAKTLIRILYFRYQNKIVLLHAYEKPANYRTKRERRKVDIQNKLAQNYLNKFKLNPNKYEKYN